MKNIKVRYSDFQIKALLSIGIGSRKLRTLHISPKRIARINQGLPAKPVGSPKKFSVEHKQFILDIVLADPEIKAKKMQEIFYDHYKITISSSTISNILKSNDIFYGKPIRIQKLRDYHIVERYNFSFEKLQSGKKFFENIVFSDECKFSDNPDSVLIYRKKGSYEEKYCSASDKFPVSFMAWGAIGYNFKSDLYIFNSTVTAESYINMFAELKFFEKAQVHFHGTNFYFEQDGASSHNNEDVIRFICERCHLVYGWPANSPDLSPVEMMWAIIKAKIASYLKNAKPSNKEELMKACIKELNDIKMEVVNRLILSFEKRLRMCLKVGGKSIVPFLRRKKYDIPDEYISQEVPLIFDPETDLEKSTVIKVVLIKLNRFRNFIKN